MKILFVILGLFALAAIAFVTWIIFGIVRCAEAQDESRDDV